MVHPALTLPGLQDPREPTFTGAGTAEGTSEASQGGPDLRASQRPDTRKTVAFSVAGPPLAQGSKFGRIINGHVVLVDMADRRTKTRKGGGLKRYKQRVSDAAKHCMLDRLMPADPWLGPIMLECEFVIPRSPSHYTAKGALRKGAPTVPRGDLDKLLRAVSDALTGVVYQDDVQIMSFDGSTKRFANKLSAVGGVFVKVTDL